MRPAIAWMGTILLVGCNGTAPPGAAVSRSPVTVDGSARPRVARVPVASDSIRLVPDKDVLGFPLVTADKVEMRRLLSTKDFDGLESAIENWEKAYLRDALFEGALLDVFNAFEDPDPRMRAQLEDWVAAKPASHFARLGRASHEFGTGTDSRGKKWAAETSDKQFESMRAAFGRAAQDVEAAFAIHPECLAGYHLQILMATFAGPARMREDLLRKGLATHPESWRLRFRYMASLEPRWGGSYSEMEAFSEEIEKDAARVPRLRVLRGAIAFDRGYSAWRKDDYATAVAEYTKALSFGPEMNAFLQRGKVLARLEQHGEALLDFEAATRLSPQYAEAVGHHARSLAQNGRTSEARKQVDLLRSLRGPSESVNDLVTGVRQTLQARGWDLAKKQGKVDEGRVALDEAVAIDPRSAEARYWRGHVFLLQQAGDKALLDFKEAVRLDPDYFEGVRSIDGVYAHRREWDRIVPFWDAFLLRNASHAGAFRERAGTKKHKGDIEGARADMKRSCELGDQQACGYAGTF